ncbi:UNVERIFIED_CONTAM: hypothetical protein GTU68_027859 [Idotea baltica]|nr:hypothetical protein [Idotea baltica]
MDNFLTGHQSNLDEVKKQVSVAQWNLFSFTQGDIRNIKDCQKVCAGVNYVLHHAALGSVPASIDDPLLANDINITGSLNVLLAARDQKVEKFIYAASSSTYGDNSVSPKTENMTGNLLSPYAVAKYTNELYASVFTRCYGITAIGLRYFNIFGPRQRLDGAYAAVIPHWIAAVMAGDKVVINGNGETSRDFCFVDNVVQANLLACLSPTKQEINPIYNVAVGQSISLNELFSLIKKASLQNNIVYNKDPVYQEFRAGDVMHSEADISKIKNDFGYNPELSFNVALDTTIKWYSAFLQEN